MRFWFPSAFPTQKKHFYSKTHSYCSEESGYPEGTGTLGIIFLLFAFCVVVYNPTKCIWHTDQWGHYPPLPLVNMEWMNKTFDKFCSLFLYRRVRTSHLWAQTECRNTGYQSERNFGVRLLPILFTSSNFPHDINFNFVKSRDFNPLNIYSVG